jgi:hypothetical protein
MDSTMRSGTKKSVTSGQNQGHDDEGEEEKRMVGDGEACCTLFSVSVTVRPLRPLDDDTALNKLGN